MANEGQAQIPTPHPRIFHSVAAAEEVYRQEQQRNDVLGAKIDDLGRTVSEKLDVIASLLQQLLASPNVQPTPPAVPPSSAIPLKFEPIPIPPPTTDTGLRPLSLGRTQSDPEVDRLQFIQRDRSIPPPSLSPTRIPVQPFTRCSPSPQQQNSDSKPIVGVKLPIFRGKYTDNVHAWLTIIRDRFRLHKTPDEEKIANISALFKDDALVWYLDLQKKYLRAPTWAEFEMELDIKFAQNPVRISWLC